MVTPGAIRHLSRSYRSSVRYMPPRSITLRTTRRRIGHTLLAPKPPPGCLPAFDRCRRLLPHETPFTSASHRATIRSMRCSGRQQCASATAVEIRYRLVGHVSHALPMPSRSPSAWSGFSIAASPSTAPLDASTPTTGGNRRRGAQRPVPLAGRGVYSLS